VSRRKARHRQQARRPSSALQSWTIQRATVIGIVCGIAAILAVGLLGTSSDTRLYGYAALLAVTALCGASILWITVFDMRARGTSGRMRPIRSFDAAIGLALLLPSLYALSLIWPELGLAD
jgi:hypothetical protein